MMLKHWLLSVLFLVGVTFSYRLSFVLYHQDLLLTSTWLEQLYALCWGLRFDVAIALPMVLLSLIFYKLYNILFTLKWHWFVMPWVLLMCVIQTGDVLYYQDAGRHIGYEFLASQGDTWSLFQHALHIGLWLVVFNMLAAACFVGLLIRFLSIKEAAGVRSKGKQVFAFVTIILVTVVGIRGGISGVPQSPIQVYQIGDSQQAMIAANPVYIVFSILSSKHQGLEPIQLPETFANFADVSTALYPEAMRLASSEAKSYNVIFILLESWNAAFMQSYLAQEYQITPNFDAFRAKSITSDVTLAGGHRTTEGMFASLCSLQNPLGSSLVNTQLLDFSYRCLPNVLREQGYATSFIQGSYKDTSGTGSFAHFLGFEESVGKVELPKGKLPHNVWGLHDDDLYEILLDKALKQTTPFFFALNTNSTHDTELPPSVQPMLDAQVPDYKHKNVMYYADAAFGRFMEKLEQSALAENTIVVAVADHTAQVRGSGLYEYAVPMAILVPQTKPKHIPFATSQRDIAPTLLEALNLPPVSSFAGKSLLSSETFFADYFHHHQLGWLEGDDLVRINVASGSKKCFEWRDDWLMKKPQPCENKDNITQQALAFTAWMQQQLFSGQTQELLKLPVP